MSAPLAHMQNHFLHALNDIFKAESAVTGQAFAFASPTQVLTMGAFGVHVAQSYWAGTSSSFTTLKNQSEKYIQKIKPLGDFLGLHND